MKIDLNKVKKLIDSDISAYRIAQLSGISQSTIGRIRGGERDIDSIHIKTARKLESCYDLIKDEIK